MSKKDNLQRQVKNAQKRLEEWTEWMKHNGVFHGSKNGYENEE